MIYFSDLINRKVFNQDNLAIGKIIDIYFLATDQPLVTVLQIRDGSNIFFINVYDLIKINHNIVIKNNFKHASITDNEISCLKNMLDKQIIDLSGNKVVRVNDIVLQEKPNLQISGVDIGIFGILRWFKLEKIVCNFLRPFHVNLLPDILAWADIHPIELARGRVMLKKTESKLKKVRPEDLADHLEKTNIVNINKTLNMLEDKFAVEVIRNLNISFQTALFKHITPEKAAKIISKVDPSEAVDILLAVSKQKHEQILQLIEPDSKKEIIYLLNLVKTPIGEHITSEYLSANSNLTAYEIINQIKKDTRNFSYMNYVYFLNNNSKLVGVCNLHELLLQDSDTPAYKFMTQNVVVIHLTTPEEIAIKKMLKYKIYALPVLDDSKNMLGIVTLDDVMDFISNKNFKIS